MTERNCYNYWEDELRYFMYKYEQYISEKRNARFRDDIWKTIFESPVNDSIEHIFPEHDPYNNWTGLMGSGKNVVEDNVNRLGNLLILPKHINSRCGTRKFSEKKQIYKDAMLHVANDVIYHNYIQDGDRSEKHEWNIKKIEQREKELIKAALEIWA